MNLPRRPVAVIFDMDGLLFDTEALYRDAIMSAASQAGHEMTLALFNQMLGCPWHQNRDLLIAHFGESFPVDDLRVSWMRHFDLMAGTRHLLKPGAIELLATLDDLQLPRAIATSSRHHSVQHHLTTHDLLGRFHEIVAHGDYAVGKPAPDPYLKAAERLGVDPRLCVALEDSYNGVRSASAAGMMTVMVPDLLEPTEEIRNLCIGVAPDLLVVRQLILAAKSKRHRPSPEHGKI